MEKVDINQVLVAKFTERDIKESRLLLIDKQLDGLERLIETGRNNMECPTCWNNVCSLIEQLRFYIPLFG